MINVFNGTDKKTNSPDSWKCKSYYWLWRCLMWNSSSSGSDRLSAAVTVQSEVWFVSAVLALFVHTCICGGAQSSSLCCEKKNKYNHTTKTKSSLSLGSVSFSVLVSLRCCVFLLRLLPQQDGEALKRFIWTNSSNFVGKNSLKVKRKEKNYFCLPSDVDFFP